MRRGLRLRSIGASFAFSIVRCSAKNTGEMAFAAEQLQEAHEIAQRVSWNEATGEERAALLVLAELFAYGDPVIAEQYLARYRTLGTR